LSDPKLTVTVEEAGEGFSVTIKSQKPALWVWQGLENTDARYADNFFHVMPGAPQLIRVQPKLALSKEEFVKELRVRSLFDTYS
jgi:hypothetical protein